MRHHVRVYRINDGELDAFVDEWRRHVLPLRRRFGFTVEHAWASEEGDTFVWVVGFDGDDWEAAERAYYDSPERAALDPDPARRVVGQHAFLARVVPLP
jgi:hypothetical protein